MTEPDESGTTGADDGSAGDQLAPEPAATAAATPSSGPATVAVAVEGVPLDDYLHDSDADDLGMPGQPFNITSPFLWAIKVGFGLALAWWLFARLEQIGSVLLLIVVSLFIAVGLNPMVEKLMRRGLKRPWAVLIVIIGVAMSILAVTVGALPRATPSPPP